MDEVVCRCPNLSKSDVAFLRKVEGDLSILADVSRADVLMYCRADQGKAIVAAHARPHSVSPIYAEPLTGREVSSEEAPLVFKALAQGRHARGHHGLISGGAPIVQGVHPIRNTQGKMIGALSIETTLIEHERHRRRSRLFRRAVRQFQEMVLRGELRGADVLSPFGEHDGILVVDNRSQIRYASGVANNLYRRLGYMETLPGKHLSALGTADEAFVSAAMEEGRCLEEEMQEGHRIWIRKAIPIITPNYRLGWLRGGSLLPHPFGLSRSAETSASLRRERSDFGEPSGRGLSGRGLSRAVERSAEPRSRRSLRTKAEPRLVGVILTIHDATEARRKERELKIKSAMIQEIHHRVKNNLQIIASLLRLQARRVEVEEMRRVLQESINRVLSVAVVHEFLSERESSVINIREMSQRIIDQTIQGMLDPARHIRLTLQGPNIYLSAQQATSCALIINELLQNAVEHGYVARRAGGTISVNLQDVGDKVTIEINDDGKGLPAGFDLNQDSSLGLRIVQTLVQDDLKGRFELRDDKGVSAIVTFPKWQMADSR